MRTPGAYGAWAAAGVVALVFTMSGAAAAVRLPVADGTYCGPGAATIGIDSQAGAVTIDGYSCTSPIFAADQLQSIQCRRDGGPPERREFDVRVFDRAMMYNGSWFRPCKS